MRIDVLARETAQFLEGARITKRNQNRIIEGTRDGIRLKIECWYTNRTNGWLITARSKAPPMLLDVKRHGVGVSKDIKQVLTMDALFDKEFLVEGVPARLVLETLDESVRRAIADAPEMFLGVDNGEITANSHSKWDAEIVHRALSMVVVLHKRIAELPMEDDPKARSEIAQLRAARERWFARLTWPQKILVVVVGSVLVAAVCAGFFYSCVPSF